MHALLETLQQAIINNNKPPKNFLKAKEKLTPTKQIKIYAHAYQERLLGILEEDYPLLQKRLGKRKFRILAKTFVAEQPPKIADLAVYSRSFAKSLKHKHNQLPADILALVAKEAAELELLGLESLPPFQPHRNATPEELLSLALMPQPASVIVGDLFLYRLGTQIFEQPISKAEAKALKQLGEATSLAKWAEQLPPASAYQVPQWLGKWILHSMLCLQK